MTEIEYDEIYGQKQKEIESRNIAQMYEKKMKELRDNIENLKSRKITKKTYQDIYQNFVSIIKAADTGAMDMDGLALVKQQTASAYMKKAQKIGLEKEGNDYYNAATSLLESSDLKVLSDNYRDFMISILTELTELIHNKICEFLDLLENVETYVDNEEKMHEENKKFMQSMNESAEGISQFNNNIECILGIIKKKQPTPEKIPKEEKQVEDIDEAADVLISKAKDVTSKWFGKIQSYILKEREKGKKGAWKTKFKYTKEWMALEKDYQKVIENLVEEWKKENEPEKKNQKEVHPEAPGEE